MSGFKYLPRECPCCGDTLAVDEIHCPHCADEGHFRFPVLHALGIAVFVAGAITFHCYPELGAVLPAPFRQRRRRPGLAGRQRRRACTSRSSACSGPSATPSSSR